MRDIAFTVLILGLLPVILWRPHVGILVWAWLGYMNPQKAMWGFADNFSFAALVALATLIGLAFSKEPKRIPWTPVTITLSVFVLWVTVTTIFALAPDEAWPQWEKVLKIQLMTFITLMLINTRERIHLLVTVITLSIGFYGVKGGIFTIMTGGNYMVLGPTNTFIAGNTEIGLALIMILPLWRYLQLTAKKLWLRWGLTAAMVLTAFAIVGTQSRGALVGIAAMGLFLWLKSRKKLLLTVIMALAVPAILLFMPDRWYARMHTIETYQEDGSAMGRIQAWKFAINLAKARPLTGGGFQTFTPRVWERYSPDPDAKSRSAHSIYFQVLGEHGFIGLALFLLLGFLTWRTGNWIIRVSKTQDNFKWATDFAAMAQASLVGYAVAGAFLGLANFDLFYHLVALTVLVRVQVENDMSRDHVPTFKLASRTTPGHNVVER